LFTADWAGLVSAWRIADQSIGARWQAHQNRIWAMELSPDGRFLATGSADRTLRTWELEPLFLGRAGISGWIEARIGEGPGRDSP
jgi:WD40 repeat protein